jgi:hypothetical protein
LVCLITEIKKSIQFSWWQTLACSFDEFDDEKLHPSAVGYIETNNKQKQKERMYKILNLPKRHLRPKLDNKATIVKIDN